jgi:hypothetical protein
MPQRDPDCTCEIEFPGARRIWCDHCLTDGPLPGSLADPNYGADDDIESED